MRIIFLPEALDYFNKLTTILYEEEYFGFEENVPSCTFIFPKRTIKHISADFFKLNWSRLFQP